MVGCSSAVSFCSTLFLLKWVSDESLGLLHEDPAIPCFRFALLKVAAPHLPVQMYSLHGRYVYYGICHSKKSSLGRIVSFWCHRTLTWSHVLIQKKNNVPQATINLVIKSVELSEVQSKFPIRDEWVWLHCYKELLSSTFCSYPICVGKPLKILCKRCIPSLVNLFSCSRVKHHNPGPWFRWVCREYYCYSWVLRICFHSKLFLVYLVH